MFPVNQMTRSSIGARDNVLIGGSRGSRPTVADCKILTLPKIADKRGNLTVIEGTTVPFPIKRVYYLYDVPGGSTRGGHAHKDLQQFLIAMSGSFDVVVDDGISRTRHHLNRSYMGIYIPKMIWRELDNFSSGSVCMALASLEFDEDDYYREYDIYRRKKIENDPIM